MTADNYVFSITAVACFIEHWRQALTPICRKTVDGDAELE